MSTSWNSTRKVRGPKFLSRPYPRASDKVLLFSTTSIYANRKAHEPPLNLHGFSQGITRYCGSYNISCVPTLNQLSGRQTSEWMIYCKDHPSRYVRLRDSHPHLHTTTLYFSLPPSRALNISVLVTMPAQEEEREPFTSWQEREIGHPR